MIFARIGDGPCYYHWNEIYAGVTIRIVGIFTWLSNQNEDFLLCTKKANLGSLSIWIALLCKSDGAAQEKCVPRWQKKQKEDQWVEWQHHLLCNVDHLSFRLELVSSLSCDKLGPFMYISRNFAVGLYQTLCPVRKSCKFSKSGLSKKGTFSIPDACFFNTLEI